MIGLWAKVFKLLQMVRALGPGLGHVGQSEQGQDLIPHPLLVGGVDVLDSSLPHSWKAI